MNVLSPEIQSPEFQAFKRFAELTAEKRHLSQRLKEIEPELRALEPQLLSYLGEGGYQMVKVEGFTMSPHREPWVYPASGVSRQVVCAALKSCGLGHFVKESFNTRTLTAYVRQLEEHHQLLAEGDPQAALSILPDGLNGVLEIKPGFRLQVLDRRKKGDHK